MTMETGAYINYIIQSINSIIYHQCQMLKYNKFVHKLGKLQRFLNHKQRSNLKPLKATRSKINFLKATIDKFYLYLFKYKNYKREEGNIKKPRGHAPLTPLFSCHLYLFTQNQQGNFVGKWLKIMFQVNKNITRLYHK